MFLNFMKPNKLIRPLGKLKYLECLFTKNSKKALGSYEPRAFAKISIYDLIYLMPKSLAKNKKYLLPEGKLHIIDFLTKIYLLKHTCCTMHKQGY